MVATASTSAAVVQPSFGSEARCQVAEAALQSISPPQQISGTETVKFLDDDVGGFPPIDLDDYDLSNKTSWKSGAAPSPELVQSFVHQQQIAALRTCAGLKEFAGSKGWTTRKTAKVEIGKTWESQRRGKNFGRKRGLVLVLLSPVLSDDGREALIEEEVVCGPLCGLGSIVYFKLDADGHWTQAAIREIWAS